MGSGVLSVRACESVSACVCVRACIHVGGCFKCVRARGVCATGIAQFKKTKKKLPTPADIGFAVADSVVGRFEKRPLPTELASLGDAY